MTKKEMINELMDLYDENEQLKRENETLRKYANTPVECNANNTLNHVDYLMIELGKKRVFKDVVYSWSKVYCTYDEETNTYKVTSYANWLNEKLAKGNIPDEMSLDEFRTYFREELQAMYEKEKTKALNEAKNIENVEEE